MASPALFKGSFVKLLKSRIEMFNNWILSTDQTGDPTSGAVSGGPGSLYSRSGTNQLYKKFDSGSSTNWKLLDQPAPFVDIDPLGDIDSMPDTTPLGNSGGTLTLTTTGAEVGIGFQGIKFVATSSGHKVTRDALTVPLGLRRNGQLGLKAIIKNNSSWTVRLVDDTNSVNIISETVNTNNQWKLIEFSGIMLADVSSCHWEFEASGSDTIYISKVSVTPDVALVSKDLIQRQTYRISQAGNAMTNRVAEIEFNLGTASITNTGTGIIVASDDSANTRTKFTAAVDCHVHADVQGLCVSADTYWIIKVNGSAVKEGQESHAASARFEGSWQGKLSAGDYLTFETSGSDLVNSSSTCVMTFSAEADVEGVITSTDNVQPAIYETNAGQSIPDVTVTIVDFEDRQTDNDSLVTTGASWKFTAPKSGFYFVTGCVIFSSSSAEYDISLDLYKNGSSHLGFFTDAKLLSTTSGEVQIVGSGLVQLAAGDYIDFRVYQASGGSLALSTTTRRNRVSIHRVDKSPIVNNIIGKWVPATVTGSWSTNTTYTAKQRRIGDSLDLIVRVALSGAPNSATFTLNMPSGLTIDSSKLPGFSANQGWMGAGMTLVAGASRYDVEVIYLNTTSFTVRVIDSSGTYGTISDITQAVPATYTNGDSIEMKIMGVPIVEWA